MTPSFKTWLGGLLMTALLVSISVAWLDKPVAIWIGDTIGRWPIPDTIVNSPGISIPFASAFVFVILGE